MIDILIFALITFFFGYKIFVALGRTSDEDADSPQASEKRSDHAKIIGTISPEKEAKQDFRKKPADEAENMAVPPSHIVSKEEREFELTLQETDPHFEMQNFKEGAIKAFPMIIKGFAEGDKNLLRSLLCDDLFETFEADIDMRDESKILREVTIDSIETLEVQDISIDGTTMSLLTNITSKQIIAEYDAENKLLEGNEDFASTISDSWVFVRDAESDSPIWRLEATNVEQ